MIFLTQNIGDIGIDILCFSALWPRHYRQLLVGLPAKLLNRLHAIINTAARLVCHHAMTADHITPVLKLKDLH